MDCNSNIKCNCTYYSCPRHKKCCDCIAYHRMSNQLPACYFDENAEKTYNRSIEYFNKINNIC